MATLERLKLSRWKSIKEAEITFGRLNVLVGANGAGKSNLVSFFRFIRELALGNLQSYVIDAGGSDVLLYRGVKHTQQLRFDLALTVARGAANYAADLRLQAVGYGLMIEEERIRIKVEDEPEVVDWRANNRPESALELVDRALYPQTPLYREIARFMSSGYPHHFHDTTATAAVRRAGYIDNNRRLRPDAGNLAAMLYVYRQTRPSIFRRILGPIKQVAPFLDDFVLEPRRLNPKEIQLDWRAVGSDYLLGPHQLSDGTLRMIALVTLLLQPESDLPPLIVIDEPELGLHPAALGILAGLLKQAAVHTQVLVATQSATLLNHFEPQDVIVVDAKDGVSSFRRLDPEPYREWIEEYGLSDLWERNVIGGGPYQ